MFSIFNNMGLGKKLGSGFGMMLLLIAVLGLVGISQISNISDSLYQVGTEQAPLVDSAKEMKLALMTARNSLEEFKGASSVIATDHEDELADIEGHYEQALVEFDTFADAISNGATLANGRVVVKTGNSVISDYAQAADTLHNEKFQVAAARMMNAGRAALEGRKNADIAMLDMEQSFFRIVEQADGAETQFKDLLEASIVRSNTLENLNALMRREVPYIDAAMELKAYMLTARVALEEVAQMTDLEEIARLEEEYNTDVNSFDEVVTAFLEGGMVDGSEMLKLNNSDITETIVSLDAEHEVFQETASRVLATRREMIALLQEAEEAMEELDGFGQDAEDLLTKLEDLVTGEMDAAKTSGANAQSVAEEMMISVGLFALVCGIVLGALVTRSVTRPIYRAMSVAEGIALGDLSADIKVHSRDETGQLLKAMQNMQQRLAHVIEAEVQQIVDAARDGDLTRRIELEGKNGFYEKLSLGINELVGESSRIVTDTQRIFSAMAQGNLDETIVADYKGSFNDLKKDANSTVAKLSSVIEKDIKAIIDGAVAGDLGQRIQLEGKHGFYRTLAASVNELVDVNDHIISDVLKMVSGMANGDLSQNISASYAGSFGKLKDDVSSLRNKLSHVIEKDIQGIVASASQGDLKQRIDLSDKNGFYRQLSASINDLVNTSDLIITDTSNVISAMSRGDLTNTIDAEYKGIFNKLKNDINSTIGQLTTTVKEIQSSAATVDGGASEISLGSSNLSQRTEEQAASLEETSSAMEELSTTVQQTAHNAMKASSLAMEARKTAENGGQVISSAIAAMTSISESSNQIGTIIAVIDEIAFQTNLLALNAAVEAARAGENGRGFAVVADEVRTLAARCAGAAKEIKELIQASSKNVAEGSEQVNKSGTNLAQIVNAIRDVSTIVEEISHAASEQSNGLEEIRKAVLSMDETTQQNAALVEETAAAAMSLGEQSNNLNRLIGFFKVDGRSHESRTRSSVQGSAIRLVK